jgi:hypothetical protein
MTDLKYTTEDAIARLLQGRLEIQPTSLGRTPIDPDLLAQIASQAEATLDNALRSLYKLPLKTQHPTLAEFVELRCLCRLIPVHFQRESVSDDRGLGNEACKQAETILSQLEAGLIKLPGELEVINLPVGLHRQQTFVRPYNPNTATDAGFGGRREKNHFSEVDPFGSAQGPRP